MNAWELYKYTTSLFITLDHSRSVAPADSSLARASGSGEVPAASEQLPAAAPDHTASHGNVDGSLAPLSSAATQGFAAVNANPAPQPGSMYQVCQTALLVTPAVYSYDSSLQPCVLVSSASESCSLIGFPEHAMGLVSRRSMYRKCCSITHLLHPQSSTRSHLIQIDPTRSHCIAGKCSSQGTDALSPRLPHTPTPQLDHTSFIPIQHNRKSSEPISHDRTALQANPAAMAQMLSALSSRTCTSFITITLDLLSHIPFSNIITPHHPPN